MAIMQQLPIKFGQSTAILSNFHVTINSHENVECRRDCLFNLQWGQNEASDPHLEVVIKIDL